MSFVESIDSYFFTLELAILVSLSVYEIEEFFCRKQVLTGPKIFNVENILNPFPKQPSKHSF